jgi:RNA polymerase sigma-70 factor (ECF subfamily)
LRVSEPVGSEELPDAELIRRALEDPRGDEGHRAASLLFERYSGQVYRWCYRYVANHDEALDLAQETLLSAFNHLDSFAGRSHFSYWLYAITRNRCRTAMRRASLTRDDGADLTLLRDAAAGPDTWAEWQDDEARLLQLFDETLDSLEWNALFLRCSEGLPVDEITRLLGIESASGARGVIQSARRKLKRVLARRDDEDREAES